MGNGFLDDLPDLEIAGSVPRKSRKKKSAPNYENVVVRYIKVRCPRCKSDKVPVYDSNHKPIRYHRCADCELNFKSIEE